MTTDLSYTLQNVDFAANYLTTEFRSGHIRERLLEGCTERLALVSPDESVPEEFRKRISAYKARMRGTHGYRETIATFDDDELHQRAQELQELAADLRAYRDSL
jgi:hypothetical protein